MKFSAPQPSLGPGIHRSDAQGGRLSEQPWLADGTRMDDRIGPRFGLLRRPGLPADPAAAGWAPDSLAVIEADSEAAAAWLDRLEADAALLRPDRYLLGVARGAQGLERLLRDGLAIIGR
jgi:3-(3-hydroxy-phenyl)propionate hydroxylase